MYPFYAPPLHHETVRFNSLIYAANLYVHLCFFFTSLTQKEESPCFISAATLNSLQFRTKQNTFL